MGYNKFFKLILLVLMGFFCNVGLASDQSYVELSQKYYEQCIELVGIQNKSIKKSDHKNASEVCVCISRNIIKSPKELQKKQKSKGASVKKVNLYELSKLIKERNLALVLLRKSELVEQDTVDDIDAKENEMISDVEEQKIILDLFETNISIKCWANKNYNTPTD